MARGVTVLPDLFAGQREPSGEDDFHLIRAQSLINVTIIPQRKLQKNYNRQIKNRHGVATKNRIKVRSIHKKVTVKAKKIMRSFAI